jgi:predicted DCC family thiol-disulfide oxidoreductase YuxK
LKEDSLRNSAFVVFDGFCNLCSSLVSFLIRIDKNAKLVFIPSQNVDYQNLIKKFPVLKENPDAVILIYGNKIFERAEAILKIFKLLGFPWKIFCVVEILPNRILDSIYNLIALKRYSIFGRRGQCFIPNKNVE